jgi:hypothetical protein
MAIRHIRPDRDVLARSAVRPHKRDDGGVYPVDRSIFSPVLDFAVSNIPIGNGAVHRSKEVPGVVAGVEDAMILADQIVPGIFTDGAEFFVDLSNRALYVGNRDNGVLIESDFLIGKLLSAASRAARLLSCAEHVRQLEGESPFDNLMEVKS